MLRFSISELLGATALLAIGFKWPLLLFFIVPLIVIAALNRLGFGNLAPVVIAIGLSLAIGVVLSLYYWRYPFVQPRLLLEMRRIRAVEQLSEVSNISTETGMSPGISALTVIPPLTSLDGDTYSVGVTNRILQDFGKRKMNIESSVPISSDQLLSIYKCAERDGLLVSGEPGYPDTKRLHGYVGIARLDDGTRFIFANLLGGQHSNDHYPYYEFVIPMARGNLSITNSQWFFVDIAGIEGANWLTFAVLSFFVVLPSGFVLQIAWVYLRPYLKRFPSQQV